MGYTRAKMGDGAVAQNRKCITNDRIVCAPPSGGDGCPEAGAKGEGTVGRGERRPGGQSRAESARCALRAWDPWAFLAAQLDNRWADSLAATRDPARTLAPLRDGVELAGDLLGGSRPQVLLRSRPPQPSGT